MPLSAKGRAQHAGISPARPAAQGACVVALLILSACGPAQHSFLDPAGPVAAAQRDHLVSITVIMLVVAAPVLILTPIIAWRFRRGSGARYQPDWDFSRQLEVIMWGTPIVVAGALGLLAMSWQLAHRTVALDPFEPLGEEASIEVQVIGLDWKWIFIYPEEGVATMSELAIPVNRPVRLRLTSGTVMQSFVVNRLAGQIYVMPGMETQLNFSASQTGDFIGRNTQFSGTGFASQTFTVRAMSETDFDTWLAAVRNEGPVLDDATFAQVAVASTPAQTVRALNAPEISNGVAHFGAVTPDLFGAVMHRSMTVGALQQERSTPANAHRAEER